MFTRLLVIGSSLGGGQALRIVLGGLSPDFPGPVVVAQHRSKETDLIPALSKVARVPVVDAEDGMALVPRHIYLAPPDYHLFVEVGNLALSLDPPVLHARPSVDVLFQSAADAYGPMVIGVILTGGGTDGAQGLAAIRKAGGLALVQDPATAEERSMPAAAILATQNAEIVPLFDISVRLNELSRASG